MLLLLEILHSLDARERGDVLWPVKVFFLIKNQITAGLLEVLFVFSSICPSSESGDGDDDSAI